MKRASVFTIVTLALLLAVPTFAADRVITNGIDLWRTEGSGMTFADFSKQTIPAGFFCAKSAPFTGQVALRGVPVATGQSSVLGRTDTIVQRLDDAVFSKRGVAMTRIQVRAMQFESLAPVKTECGDFSLKVVLDGEQPVTTMRIVRDNAKGGRFFAPISVNIKLSFAPVGRVTTEVFELRKGVQFPPALNAQWSAKPRNAGVASEGFVKVDTDGDAVPDTFLPGTSNFRAGRTAVAQKATEICHIDTDGTHCTIAEY